MTETRSTDTAQTRTRNEGVPGGRGIVYGRDGELGVRVHELAAV